MRGELRAGGEAIVNVTLRRQGIMVTKVKKKVYRSGKKITDKDITLFTRQLATMMKAGVPLLQSFDIVGKGHAQPVDVQADPGPARRRRDRHQPEPARSASSRCTSTRCSATWSGAGEQAGILEDLLTRLAIYKEKTLAIKGKIKSALIYPIVHPGASPSSSPP